MAWVRGEKDDDRHFPWRMHWLSYKVTYWANKDSTPIWDPFITAIYVAIMGYVFIPFTLDHGVGVGSKATQIMRGSCCYRAPKSPSISTNKFLLLRSYDFSILETVSKQM
jgi:hypothetical protein